MLQLLTLYTLLASTPNPEPTGCTYGADTPCGAVLDGLMLLWVHDDCPGEAYYPDDVASRVTGYVSVGRCIVPTLPELPAPRVCAEWARLAGDTRAPCVSS